MSSSQYSEWQGHIEHGHRIPIMAGIQLLVEGSCSAHSPTIPRSTSGPSQHKVGGLLRFK